MSATDQHLVVDKVSKSYDKTVPLLRSVSFSLQRGERVALLGRSGSGKSTLLNLIAGIDQLDTGMVIVDGQSLAELNERQRTQFRRRNIGVVYQSFNLIDTLTAAENIELPLQLNGVARSQREALVKDFLQRTGLQQQAQAFPDQLSGGEQQRVAIARAMIHAPALVLADEHTGNLDARSGARIAELFDAMAVQMQQTVLMVTHSQQVADSADRVLALQDGKLLTDSGGFAW